MFTLAIIVGVIAALVWVLGGVGGLAAARIITFVCIIVIIALLLLGQGKLGVWWATP
jgi:hypothetical protein